MTARTREIILWVVLTVAPTAALAQANCVQSDERTSTAIRSLWRGEDTGDVFAALMSKPQQAACQLVKELRVIKPRTILHSEYDRYPDEMQVIMSVRALRYISNCLDFRATTKERLPALKPGSERPLAESRGSFLMRAAPGVPFFAEWMSRGIIFVAASDAQRAIIAKWKQWIKTTDDFTFKACPDAQDWYF